MQTLVNAAMALLLGTSALSMAMYMPEDAEILDGYVLDDANDQISPEDMYFEVRSLTGHGMRPIRNKRAAKYEVLQSAGLASHFLQKSAQHQPQLVAAVGIGSVRRVVRSVGMEGAKSTKVESTEESIGASEQLPTAQKQTQDEQRYATAEDQSAFGSDMVDRWTTAPFEYTKLQRQNSEDSLAPNGLVNEGVKSRTPRVHFVTQQKKNTVEDKFSTMMGGDLSVASANKADSYKHARTERLEEENRGYLPNRYSDYDAYTRRYDRYDMPLPNYMRSLDYMPRNPMPYPLDYYGYPERRFDLPDYRDNRNLYSNDITERYPIALDMKPPRNSRIIYYANLPEIVRTPPSVDLRYRTYDTRYDYPGYPPYSPYYRPSGLVAGASNAYGIKSGALKADRIQQATGKREAIGQVQVTGGLTVKDAPANAKTKVLRRAHDLDRYY